MKRTLLELTQSILNDLDGEAVNSIFDTEEAIQYANVVRDTYFNIVAARQTPEHDELLKLTALSDSTKPTILKYPVNLKEIRLFEYDGKEVYWKDPIRFLDNLPNADDPNVVTFTDPVSGIVLTCRSDKGPRYYTSFDNEYLICDSFDLSVDTIAYCRIGERSAFSWFVLHELLGVNNVKNYDGSWTEYGSLVGVPVAVGA